jgi:hypothetical protein
MLTYAVETLTYADKKAEQVELESFFPDIEPLFFIFQINSFFL